MRFQWMKQAGEAGNGGGGGSAPANAAGGAANPPPNHEEMAKRLADMEAANKRLAEENAQWREVGTQLLSREEQLRRAQTTPAPPAEDEDEVDEATKKVIAKHTGKLQADLQAQLAAVQDGQDALAFATFAAQAGVTPEEQAAATKIFEDWRRTGMRLTDQTGAVRTPTRADALRFALSEQALSERVKAAPQRNVASLRQQLNLVGSEAPGPGMGAGGSGAAPIDYRELERLSPKERIAKLEERLADNPF